MRRAAPFLAAVALLAGCASTDDAPKAYLDLWERGQGQVRDGDYGSARKTFRDVLAKYPKQPFNPNVELLLSDCEHQLGNEAEARQIREKVAREATAADIKWLANRGLGRMALEREDFAEALARFQAAAAASADAPLDERASLACQTGIALQGAGRFAEARAAFRKTIEMAPGSSAAKGARVGLLYPDHFAVQTGAFRSAENAEKQRALLASKGFAAEVVEMDLPQGNLHCVRVGKFRERDPAKALLGRIRKAKILPETVKLTVKP
jgi:tetratricopeptide (TPR) repeat protein